MFELRQTEEFKAWANSLRDDAFRAILAKRLIRVAAGNLGDIKALGDGVSELRFAVGPGYRVYLAQRGASLVILLGGGDKSSQARDIKRAKALVLELDP